MNGAGCLGGITGKVYSTTKLWDSPLISGGHSSLGVIEREGVGEFSPASWKRTTLKSDLLQFVPGVSLQSWVIDQP